MKRDQLVLSLAVVACAMGIAWNDIGHNALHAQTPEPRKRALLVGVSNYTRPGMKNPYLNLKGEKDVDKVREVLIDRFGFAPADITVLNSKEATKAGIERAFRKRLIAPTQPGDIVYFHFAGHGSRVKDRNGDEAMDHYDETLVPSDYISKSDQSREILDDEISTWLRDLSERKPSNTTLVFDCCHSGTVTRGRLRTRGVAANPSPTDVSNQQGMFDSETTPAHVVAISACRNDQNAFEFESSDDKGPAGLLTLALTQAFGDCDPSTTYGDLMDRIETFILRQTREQSPQMEGDPELPVLGSTAIPTESHFDVRFDSNKQPYVTAGLIHGSTIGSEFTLYPAGTKQFESAKPLCKAVVHEATLTRSYLKVIGDPALPPETIESSRALMTATQYGDNRLRLNLEGIPETDLVASQVRAFPLVQAIVAGNEAWDLRLSAVQARGGKSTYLVERMDGTRMGQTSSVAGVESFVKQEVCGRMLRTLANQDPTGRIEVEVRPVPVQVRLNSQKQVAEVIGPLPVTRGPSGRILMKPGDHYVLEVRNMGEALAHVTVLNIQSDGVIAPMYPLPKIPEVNYRNNTVEPSGEWKQLGADLVGSGQMRRFVFLVEESTGLETIKVIATAEPLDFSPLLDTTTVRSVRGTDYNGVAQTPLGRLLKAATLGTRSTSNIVAPANWATHEMVYDVVSNRSTH